MYTVFVTGGEHVYDTLRFGLGWPDHYYDLAHKTQMIFEEAYENIRRQSSQGKVFHPPEVESYLRLFAESEQKRADMQMQHNCSLAAFAKQLKRLTDEKESIRKDLAICEDTIKFQEERIIKLTARLKPPPSMARSRRKKFETVSFLFSPREFDRPTLGSEDAFSSSGACFESTMGVDSEDSGDSQRLAILVEAEVDPGLIDE